MDNKRSRTAPTVHIRSHVWTDNSCTRQLFKPLKDLPSIRSETRFQERIGKPLQDRVVGVVLYSCNVSNRTSRPYVPMNLQNLCLARLLTCLESAVPHRLSVPTSCPRALTQDVPLMARPISPVHQIPLEGVDNPKKRAKLIQSDDSKEVHAHRLTVGINQVTRVLESQLQSTRKHAVLHFPEQRHDQHPEFSPLAAVFACSVDIDPPLLIEHIPHLIASCNSLVPTAQQQQKVKLMPLPKGSEFAIAAAMGLRRAAVIGIHVGSPSLHLNSIFSPTQRDNPILEPLRDILDVIPDLIAPWLSSIELHQLVPTHIKQLRTTAPRDMRAAKEKRTRARKEAKRKGRAAPLGRRLTLTADTVA